jgi:hypothetical protein
VRSFFAALLLASVAMPDAVAQDATLLAAVDDDPLALARWVDRRGDAALLDALESDRPALRLAAIRAARWMSGPEAALEPLARLAAGRDPDLAPAAALACYRIVRDLDAVALDRREVLRGRLAPARKALAALQGDGAARLDLRRLAGFSVEGLEALGVPR